ncbi:efflux RND transporter permease subunit, partial [bacterium]|nr:efflux RND transporter permease subunit [bacterium]
EMGIDIRDSADKGTSEVAMAITASTLTTISVFVPILFVPGIAGAMFKDMVVTICFSLGVSLIVALTLVPLLASRILKKRGVPKRINHMSKISNQIGSGIDRLRNFYVRRLDWAVKHRKTVIWSTLVTLVASILLIIFALGGEFMPEGDMGYVQLAVDRSPGTSLEAMENSIRKLNKIIKEHVPEAEMVYNNIGQGEGVFAAFSSRASNESEIMIRLVSRTKRDRSLQEIQDDLRGRVKVLPDLDVRFEDRGAAMMMGGGASIVVQIFGHDLEVAEALGNDISSRVKDVEHVTEVVLSIEKAAPELKVVLDRQRIADLGLSTAQVGQVISTSIMGSVVSRFRESGDEYDIRVQLKPESRENKQHLENILIMTPMGRHVPLRAIADVRYGSAPAEIVREDQERLVTVSITCPSNKLRNATADVKDVLKQVAVPNDFRISISGQAEEMMKSFMYLGLAFVVAMILVYMVMASQFESLRDPFIILFTIPMSIIGVALGLFVTGTTLSVMSIIGVIMLLGIIVNNGIVLVDYINQMRAKGHEMFEAIHIAGEARMRPVIMTALTTMLAMMPLALGLGESGENWAPMARSVIGGLAVGTVLTLIVVPVIYSSVELGGEKRKARRAAKKQARLAKQGLA